jgi:hypothetical protein
MIQGKTEKEYRMLVMDSSSSLKEFSMDRQKYRKKYLLNERVEEEANKAATTGRVVECLLLEPELFDSRFHLSVVTKAPTGLMEAFVESLYKHTMECTDEEGNVSREFSEICKDAYTDSGFKIKLEAVLAKFIGSDAEIYYKEIREVRSKGLTVITTEDISNAERIVEELKTNRVTADIVNLVNSDRYLILNQVQVEGYSIKGHLFKSMMDKVIVDHHERTIQCYDLKCTWSVENFYEEYYLYRRAYIQAYLYYHACEQIKEAYKLEGYEILLPKFIVCDSINYYSPLIYTLDENDMRDAYAGFEYKGRKYPGVSSIIDELKWCLETDIWKISRKNSLHGGVINIKG